MDLKTNNAPILSDLIPRAETTSLDRPSDSWQQFINTFRQAVWRMESATEIETILLLIRDGLEGQGISFWSFGVNLVAANTDPPSVWQSNLATPSTWTLTGPKGRDTLYEFWRRQTIVYRQDLQRDDPWGDMEWIYKFDLPVRAIIDIPFSHGTFAVNSSQANPYSKEEIGHLTQIAQVLSEAFHHLENLNKISGLLDELAGTRKILDEKTQLIEIFQQVGRSLLSSLDIVVILEEFIGQIVKKGILRSLVVALVDPKKNIIELKRSLYPGSKGRFNSSFPKKDVPLDGPDILADVVRLGRLEVVEGWDEARYDPEVDAPENHQDRVAYFIPLKKEDQVLGVLATGSRLEEREQYLLRIEAMAPLLDQLAIAVDHAHLYQERTEQARQLEEAYATLEERVEERTAELHHLNQALTAEVKERQKAETSLLEYQNQLRSLTSQLTMVEERQRRHFANTIHDHIGQNLAFCHMKLQGLRAQLASTRWEAPLEEIGQHQRQLIQATRTLIFELSPPVLYELGLEAGLKWLARQMAQQHSITVEITPLTPDKPAQPLEEDIQVMVFQIVRELLTNTVKHAKTDLAQVTLENSDTELVVQVIDKGRGFDAARARPAAGPMKGFGLFSIQERVNLFGGKFLLETQKGCGTKIVLHIPLQTDPQ